MSKVVDAVVGVGVVVALATVVAWLVRRVAQFLVRRGAASRLFLSSSHGLSSKKA